VTSNLCVDRQSQLRDSRCAPAKLAQFVVVTRRGKTGGGVGTNQYKVRGQAKKRLKKWFKETRGYPADQVIQRGDWVLPDQDDYVDVRGEDKPEPVAKNPDPLVRRTAAQHMPIDRLAWAIYDEDREVRAAAAERMPPDQLEWAAKDPNWYVREVAAWRMPPDQLEWATTDEDWSIRRTAAERMPPDQLRWAIHDEEPDVRLIAAQRMPPDQLMWTAGDESWRVRQAGHERMPFKVW